MAGGGKRRLGVIVCGATGALVRSQHLPALLAIRDEGGVALASGERAVPDLMLVGRDKARIEKLAAEIGVENCAIDLNAALASRDHDIFFDAAPTGGRFARIQRAIQSGKHVYSEKPLAGTLDEAMALVRAAGEAGLRNGVVQDKLELPGFAKLRELRQSGFFGRILEVRLEFGRWIFDGEKYPGQRPSWNYRKRDGGGLILDMFPHWRYMIEGVAGEISAVSCVTRTQTPRRRDEHNRPYDVDVEDSAFAQMEFAGGAVASVNSSWATRIRRDDVITIQIDGTDASAVAGAYVCHVQTEADTPKAARSVNFRQQQDFFGQWRKVVDAPSSINAYRPGWEQFIRHVAEGAPFACPFIEGAKGVQLAEASHRSARERRWIEVAKLA